MSSNKAVYDAVMLRIEEILDACPDTPEAKELNLLAPLAEFYEKQFFPIANKKIFAPWTDAQVAALNAWQNNERVHPYTCGGDRGNEAHRKYAQEHGEDNGQLIATRLGWVCPCCAYTQNWASDYMFEPFEGDPRIPL